jgi:hypothetical protein
VAKQTRNQRKTTGTKRKAPAKKSVAKATAAKAEVPAEPKQLVSSWQLARRSLSLIWINRKFFGIMLGVFAALDLLLVHSVTAFNVTNLKGALSADQTHGAGQLVGSLNIFSTMFSSASAGASGTSTGAYHFMVLLVVTLAVIWALRQMYQSIDKPAPLSVKLAFYNGPLPLVPFMLLCLLLIVQILPVMFASLIYSLMIQSGVAVNALEVIITALVIVVLAVLSVIWLCRTVVAIYAVTLPGMMPLTAYKEAKRLVTGRRLSIIRKLLFLPIALFVVSGAIMIPVIMIWAPLAQWLFFAMSLVGLFIVHTYLFTLYQELLDE